METHRPRGLWKTIIYWRTEEWEDKEIELQRRKGKEHRIAAFEDGYLMSIKFLSENEVHAVRVERKLEPGIQEIIIGILRNNVDTSLGS